MSIDVLNSYDEASDLCPQYSDHVTINTLELEKVGYINENSDIKTTILIPNCFVKNFTAQLTLHESSNILMISRIVISKFGRNLVRTKNDSVTFTASHGDDRTPDVGQIDFGGIFNTNAYCSGKPFMCSDVENEIELTISAKFMDNSGLQNGQKYNFTLEFVGDSVFKEEKGSVRFEFNPWGKWKIKHWVHGYFELRKFLLHFWIYCEMQWLISLHWILWFKMVEFWLNIPRTELQVYIRPFFRPFLTFFRSVLTFFSAIFDLFFGHFWRFFDQFWPFFRLFLTFFSAIFDVFSISFDLFFGYFWPFFRPFETGLRLGKSWQRLGLRLAKSWPRLGLRLAKSWPRLGLRLAKSWPRLGLRLGKTWPRLGLRLGKTWIKTCQVLAKTWIKTCQVLAKTWIKTCQVLAKTWIKTCQVLAKSDKS